MRKGHCRWLKKMIFWWMAKYPEISEVGIRVLSTEDKADPMKLYHPCDRDIVYVGLRVDMVLSYVAATKKGMSQTETKFNATITGKRFMMQFS